MSSSPTQSFDPFGVRDSFDTGNGTATLYRLSRLADAGLGDIDRLPFSIRVLLESVLRNCDDFSVTQNDVKNLAAWNAGDVAKDEVPFKPYRVVLQDFTGVPAVVDLAAMRSAMHRLGGDPSRINPLIPVDLVIDHSVQVDFFGGSDSLARNVEKEFERNRERYEFLKWGQQAFDNFNVVPPNVGIVHQVNLEYLARVVAIRETADGPVAMPDTLVGTDSHTTMINGLGVLGWGVGGIEAEANMLGQPLYMLMPEVIGFELTGELPAGATATDMVLRVVELLRAEGVVGKFVEFFGPGMNRMSVADRATIANMAPEYGATMGFFPVDEGTLLYLRQTGRDEHTVQLVERYCKEQGLFRVDDGPAIRYTKSLSLDLSTIEPSMAGPKRPQDRIPLKQMKRSFNESLTAPVGKTGFGLEPSRLNATATVANNGHSSDIGHGAVVIAAITSCTNTSNPSVMMGAGLLAQKAVERGLTVAPHVKTSLAPGSRVVTDYLDKSGLSEPLNRLGFNTVGYGCTSCIAEGTAVLRSDGTAVAIESFAKSGGDRLFAPRDDGSLTVADQTERMDQGRRDCVRLTFQDGRTLVCTPDHRLLLTDGTWKTAGSLVVGDDRVVMGIDGPTDRVGEDESDWSLETEGFSLDLSNPPNRRRTLAYVRLLGHWIGDGSISVPPSGKRIGQGRMNVGQAVDRRVVLDDIEYVSGKRPKGSRYDDRKWSIALPAELTASYLSIDGVTAGRQIAHPPSWPAFVVDPQCPVAVLREFLGGLFGADGHSPLLHRYGRGGDQASFSPPAFSRSFLDSHVAAGRTWMRTLGDLLRRCGVAIEENRIAVYPVRFAESTYPAAVDGRSRNEIRLTLGDGLSFVEKVGYRYSIDKQLRASAAAVYWRTVAGIGRQRLAVASRIDAVHRRCPAQSFTAVRTAVAAEVARDEAILHEHYSLLLGHDRFDRLPTSGGRPFRPLHRGTAKFPSAPAMMQEIGAGQWFSVACDASPMNTENGTSPRYVTDKASDHLPTFGLRLIDRRPAGKRTVYDLSVDPVHAFIANGVAVHNCIGNSGPLPAPVATAIADGDLIASAVLSGNRNFEGRVNPLTKANYLASPPLVVAYALAGTTDIDFETEPIGHDETGGEVYLRDIWPTAEEVRDSIAGSMSPEAFIKEYGEAVSGNDYWNAIDAAGGAIYPWSDDSTYIQHPPFLNSVTDDAIGSLSPIRGARCLALLNDSVTTDHISPAGAIATDGPAGRYLQDRGVEVRDFNSFGSRRGNDRVMVRGTFANIRIRNQLAPGTEGGVTRHLPTGEVTSIYDASMRYQDAGTPLVVIGGTEYGTGSSRDWAAKGTMLLGVKAVIVASYERIHRSNLVGMGVLPLEFADGQTWQSLGLSGEEHFDIPVDDSIQPRSTITVTATDASDNVTTFDCVVRIDTPVELQYYKNGGILNTVLRNLQSN